MSIVRAADLVLSKGDIRRAGAVFGIEQLVSIGGYENALFRTDESGGRIVRLTHTSRRSVSMVEAEFSFIDHLARHDVPVVAPVLNGEGRLVAELRTDAGDEIVVVCMTEARGGRRPADEWSDDEIESYGAVLGAMHAASESCVPLSDAGRPAWDDPIFDVGIGGLKESHPDLHRRNEEIVAAGRAHHAGGHGLLIHQDLHLGNLFVTEHGDITVFDFDDSAYGTAIHDVAIVLFYWMLGRDGDPQVELRRFLRLFLKGYERHARLPSAWPNGADLFMSYREIDIYWLVAREPNVDSSEAELRFMDGRLERILDGVPLLGAPLADLL